MSLESTVQEFTVATEQLLQAVDLRKADLDAAVVAAQTASTAAIAAKTTAETAALDAAAAEQASVNLATNLTVSATTLAPGSSATANYNSEDLSLALGLPAGAKGDAGDTGAPGIVSSTTAPSTTSVLWLDPLDTSSAVVPPGGILGQVLAKATSADYALEWKTLSFSPAGADTLLQFNDAGVFGADSGLAYNKATGALTLGGKTVTTSAPVLNLSQTWNAGGVTFTGLDFNVTDTASAAASLLMNLRVGGSSKFNIRKDGFVFAGGVSTAGGIYSATSNVGIGINNTNMILASTGRINWTTGDLAQAFSAYLYWTGPGEIGVGGSLNVNSTLKIANNAWLVGEATQTLAQRNGTNAQTFRVYNTYTDASNYERGFLRWSSNVLEIGTEAAGTGTSRNISIGNTSNVVTICGKTFQYRNSTSITIGASITATTFTTNGDVTDFNSNVSLASSSLITWTSTSRHNNGTQDVILLRDAAGTLAQRNGTNAQIFNLYNTYTDAANYERGFLRWNANVLQLGSEALGTGTQRQLQFPLGTVAASTPLSITQTWNNAAVTFSGVQLDFTDTASNSGSRILDFRINGASKLAVLKNGALFGHYDGGGIYIGQYAFKFGRGGFIDNGTAFAQFTTPHITPSFQISSDMSINWTSAGSLGGTADLFLRRDATATLAQRDGTNAQTFRLYNTYTDASNYERGFLRWNTNVLEIGTEAAGTGAVREIRVPMTTSSKWSFFSATDRRLDITFNGQHFAFNNSVTAIYIGGAQGVVLGASNVGGDNGVGFGSAGSVTVGRDAAFTLTCSPRISDVLAKNVSLTAGPAWASASTNIIGGHIVLTGGNGASASTGAANGGNIYLRGGTGYGTGKVGNVILDTLPTSASGLPTGALWNNFGIIRAIDGTNDDGRIKVTNNVTLSAEAATLASTTTQQVAAFAATSFRSAKFIAQVYDTVTGEVQVSEILLAHNGSTATYTEYGVVYTGSAPLVDYSADISGGNVRLLATRTTANSTQYKVSETLILA